MKDTGDLFSKICDMDNLRKAHKNAKRGKGWYAEVKCIEKDLDHYLKRLQENLIEHRYHTSEYEIFTKKESNKEREIYKLPYYPDRICQWAILQVIEPYLLNSMTKDTYSARELDEFMAVNLKQVLKHNWQVFPTKVRGVDFVGYRFFGEYTLLRKSTCKTFKRRMLSISSKRENNVSPTYSEWCSFNSYVGWLQHCDSFRLYQKYVEPNVEYMHNYYLKEVKGNAEICKRKNYSGERKAS